MARGPLLPPPHPRAMPRSKFSAKRPLKIGFVPLVDSAPLAMASALGLFEKFGVKATLHAEIGWATIRDKIIYGELDAAQAPAGLMVATKWGLGAPQTDCVTGIVLNLQGNAVTLSQELWNRGVRDGATLRAYISQSKEVLTLATVYAYSSHLLLLRTWLRKHRIDPDESVRLVVVPPPQLPGNLKAGRLDGYCAGEPWTSAAVQAGTGWCAAISSELSPLHPEKVLMVTEAFASRRKEEHLALIAALIESCRFCDAIENRKHVADLLATSEYVGTPAVRKSLAGPFDFGNGRVEDAGKFHVFSEGAANEPTAERARWVLAGMKECGAAPPSGSARGAGEECFRSELYREAQALLGPPRSRAHSALL